MNLFTAEDAWAAAMSLISDCLEAVDGLIAEIIVSTFLSLSSFVVSFT